MALRNSRVSNKILLFKSGRSNDAWPSEPVVGDHMIVVGSDHRTLVALQRSDFSIAWRSHVSGLVPIFWWNNDLLVMGGGHDAAVWAVSSKRLLWRVKADLGGARSWGNALVIWRTESDAELLDPSSGEVQRTYKAVGPGAVCSDLLICRSIEARDPVQALRFDGEVAWRRELLAEIRSQPTEAGPNTYLVVQPSSVPGRFIASYGVSCIGCALTDGAILWRQNVAIPYHYVSDSGRILILNWKRFAVIDEATGELLCDRTHPELQSMYHVKPGSIVGTLVVFVSESGHVAAFDIKNGDLVFLEHHRNVEFWGTAVADGRLLVSASDGNLWVYADLARD